jgi:L-iditol 2-dehydrogenase
VVVEAAGSPRAFEEGVRLARNGGTYVIAGHYTNTGDSVINAHEHINRKHLDIRGCWGSEAGHFLRALRALERYGADVPWARIGAKTYGLGQINEALEMAGALRIPKALVDPWI